MQIWQRNLYTIWVAELIAISGFSVIQPFIPYFIQELGVTDLAQVEIYSGLSISLHAFSMALFAPIWGALADRHGRKIMVERSMFGGAVLFAAMAFVRDVPSLLLLRALQGCLTGTVAAATTLVASSAPRERSGYALGTLQVAIYMGALLGPVMGGFVADAWGYRAAFYVTSALLGVAGLLVLFLVDEHFQPVASKPGDGGFWRGLRLVLGSPVLLPIFVMRVLLRLGDRTLGPVLPLFVQSLLPVGAKVASMTGLITGVGAAASAVGAVSLGRASDRLGYRPILLVCALGAATFYAPQYFVTDTSQLLILQAVVGFLLGGTLTSLSAMLARVAPEGRQGAVYGVDASVVSVANSVGPMLGAGIAVGFGLRPVFLFSAGLFLLAGLAVARLMPKGIRTNTDDS